MDITSRSAVAYAQGTALASALSCVFYVIWIGLIETSLTPLLPQTFENYKTVTKAVEFLLTIVTGAMSPGVQYSGLNTFAMGPSAAVLYIRVAHTLGSS